MQEAETKEKSIGTFDASSEIWSVAFGILFILLMLVLISKMAESAENRRLLQPRPAQIQTKDSSRLTEARRKAEDMFWKR